MHPERGLSADARLSALFEAHFDALLSYARRRTTQLSDAEDVVAETFAIAHRRRDDLPAAREEHLPWLYGVARRVLANQRRAGDRRIRLLDRLRSVRREEPASVDIGPVLEALERLGDTDREILRLVAWEGLDHAEAGVALGISSNAAAIRLHRARRRLATAMDDLKESAPRRTWIRWKGSSTHTTRREEIT